MSLFHASGPAGVYSKLTSGVGNNRYNSVSTTGSASESLEENNDTEHSGDSNTDLQEQGLTPQINTFGTDGAEAVVVSEEKQIGHNNLAARPGMTLLLPPATTPSEMQSLTLSLPAGVQTSGGLQEHSHAGTGSPPKSAIGLNELGRARSQGGAHLKVKAGVTPQRQFEPWDLLFELDYYHLFLCMGLTSVSGLYIAGKVPLWSLHFYGIRTRATVQVGVPLCFLRLLTLWCLTQKPDFEQTQTCPRTTQTHGLGGHKTYIQQSPTSIVPRVFVCMACLSPGDELVIWSLWREWDLLFTRSI